MMCLRRCLMNATNRKLSKPLDITVPFGCAAFGVQNVSSAAPIPNSIATNVMQITFRINGRPFVVDSSSVPIGTSLNTFVRQHAQLTGTKFMCLEGGCGVCLVTLRGTHPVTKEPRTWAVNSCLAPVYACHDLEIITVEGIGNRTDGFHPVQERLYDCSGSQCGYCSSGMIVNMYSLLESSANGAPLSALDVENSFGGNLCRCTGYRPIMDAFKSLATDVRNCRANDEPDSLEDIEDLGKLCPRTGSSCAGVCPAGQSLVLRFADGGQWHRVTAVAEIFEIFDKCGAMPYMLVAGNTAHGVYRRSAALQLFIDVNGVPELRSHTIDSSIGLTLGANVNLTETMAILRSSANTAGFEYCSRLADHIDLIANVPVRNAGTIAGNLSIKNAHHDFPSDMFLILEACGALVSIRGTDGNTLRITVADFVKLDMNKRVMINVTLPPLDAAVYRYRSYKIMPRAQNAHAYVNAAILAEIDGNGKCETIRICFGGIAEDFVHAKETESALVGRDLYTDESLKLAVASLTNELHLDWVLPDADPEYRKSLAISLYYKFLLSSVADSTKIPATLLSGGTVMQRPLSSGVQSFDTAKDLYPLTEPVRKLEGLMQVSGAAKYANDMPPMKDELWAAYVLAGRPHVTIGKIDPAEALLMAGVHAFYSAKDIPGVNNFAPPLFLMGEVEEIFVGLQSEVKFYGQPIGVILANTMDLANLAATKVKVTYIEPPDNEESSAISVAMKWLSPFGGRTQPERQVIPTLKDAIALNATDRFTSVERGSVQATSIGVNASKTISGHLDLGSQYHFTMETQTTVCIPNVEDELQVYCATQWPDLAHCAIAQSLGLAENKINLTVRRLGGAYGAKITRSAQVACACALAAHLSGRPVRFVLTIEANMTTVGKRYALASDYSVQVDETGRIQRLHNKFVQDYGCSGNEPVPYFTLEAFPNCYRNETFTVESQQALTDSPSHTFCRAPGTTEGIAMIETIMEHIAVATGRDSIEVRLANCAADSEIHRLMPQFLAEVEFAERRRAVDEFNAANRWKKRGIAVVPMRYPVGYFGGYSVYMAIYHLDGTVAVSHSGVECGQGINTKLAQVTAHALGIGLDMVRVKTTDNLISANAFITGGSITSEMVCFAATKACAKLLERMRPIRETLPKTATWAEITSACNAKLIDLTTKAVCKATELKPYMVWGLSCAELEVDVLTGNVLLHRVDILEDVGESMSPTVDVGQVEGAFVMGLGYWLTESLVYDRHNGELLTNRTWTYKPPGVKDIPVDFRVRFLRNSSNSAGVLRSKATGEPAFCMSVVVIFALRDALKSARLQAGLPADEWFELGSACTPDVVFKAAATDPGKFAI